MYNLFEYENVLSFASDDTGPKEQKSAGIIFNTQFQEINAFYQLTSCAMKVIGAGLPKTGTKSLAAALSHLGYTVHDVEEHWRFHCDEYIAALEGRTPNFRDIYRNVDAVTDAPACLFYKEISKAFPDAKVVLSVRDDAETWRKSFLTTVGIFIPNTDSLVMKLCKYFTPTGRRWNRLMQLQGPWMDYSKHNIEVIASIPANQLLVFNPKEGWEPLCAFLGVEVPDIPFPRLNRKSKDIPRIIHDSWSVRRMKKELALMFTVFVGLIACARTYILT
ncbi:uncharacterized protein LOC116617560 [Nematostella vectensis]|uniref:uncharacterized protein LOC116617560 n=1 Tax=Nematostella vectensis TaxID=45351 RepID=UPI00139046BA|nr:uncharacterized protein LOC116617560 [Nematostella vectensis]